MSEGSIPTAKKDMLNFALRDKEAQLREVRARQDALRMEEELKKAEEEARKKAQAATEEEKKEGSEATETTEPPKLSQLIKELAQQIVTDFLKNEAFQKQVCDTHGEQMNLINRYKQLAREIIDEACSPIFNCAKT